MISHGVEISIAGGGAYEKDEAIKTQEWAFFLFFFFSFSLFFLYHIFGVKVQEIA